ncbi:MAG TPA: 5-(carboxyamino)imidazole ribonucleotide synthase [Propionibacteriaceae bacterium]|mgnify:FL=1|nr:5-(carboxyamino)imidazole ribonucleotide synthase [Propionibacteriaceae bacterium]HQE32288.1 5-(carboxyamino)imidazole ribonucleotide synthase [Propionibacteriaceae bacterium]
MTTVGIVGGGQLARMMHAASIGLGLRVSLLAEGPDVSAAQVVRDVVVGDYTDAATLLAFAQGVDVVTFDHEHVPTPILESLVASGIPVRPGPTALVHAQDKAVMRERLASHGAHAPRHRVVATPADLAAFGDEVGWPVIAKTSRGGYDGKGVWKVDDHDGCHEPFEALTRAQGPTERQAAGPDATQPVVQILAEEYVPFVRELSAIVARSPHGQAVAYPISESVQVAGICVETTTPAPGLTEAQAVECQRLALEIAAELDVTGILAVELMEHPDGRIVVNELAMRPHNTGHWTIDGAHTSQFENHLRAVCDMPLGLPTTRAAWTVMRNVLGGARTDLVAGLDEVLARDPSLKVQLYGKSVVPGRKVGHVTAYGDDLDDVRRRARDGAEYLRGGDA